MIYICIPAYNEARTVGVLLWRVRRVMDEFRRDYHVLVLDDGSTDDTAEVLAPYAQVLPLTLLRNERTQGYPAALERLIREAVHRASHPKRDVLVVLQADFTESPDDVPTLVKRIEGGADVAAASVARTEGELPRALRWGRRGLPWLLGRAKYPKEIRDPLSGFRAYRMAVLKRALQEKDGAPLLTRAGWAANAELLLHVAPHVRRAEDAEVSMRYTRRERETRFRPWSTALELWGLSRRAPRLAPAPVPAAPEAPAPRAEAPPAPRAPAASPQKAATPASADASLKPSPDGAPKPPAAPRPRRPKRPKPEGAAPAAPAAGVVPAAEPAPAGEAGEQKEGPARPRRRRRGRGPRRGGGGTSSAPPPPEAGG